MRHVGTGGPLDRLDPISTVDCWLLASFASVAVAAALERENVARLLAGLDTNRSIGAAVGILMATHRIGQDDAFQILAQASQWLNRKLRDPAADIVGSAPPGGR